MSGVGSWPVSARRAPMVLRRAHASSIPVPGQTPGSALDAMLQGHTVHNESAHGGTAETLCHRPTSVRANGL